MEYTQHPPTTDAEGKGSYLLIKWLGALTNRPRMSDRQRDRLVMSYPRWIQDSCTAKKAHARRMDPDVGYLDALYRLMWCDMWRNVYQVPTQSKNGARSCRSMDPTRQHDDVTDHAQGSSREELYVSSMMEIFLK